MKKTIYTTTLLFLLIFSSLGLFAQWEGSGTEENPYRIYTVQDLNLINTNEVNFNSYNNIHFELMNNIDDTLYTKLGDEFCGYFHGKGHYITLGFNDTTSTMSDMKNVLFIELYGTIDSLTLEGKVSNFISLFKDIATNGKLLNVTSNLNIEPSLTQFCVFTFENKGTIEACVNNSNIYYDKNSIVFCGIFVIGINSGQIINCINNGNISIHNIQGAFCSIFAFHNHNQGLIYNTINNGDIEVGAGTSSIRLSGFVFNNSGEINNCINTGNINARRSHIAGAFAGSNNGIISNCLNTGIVRVTNNGVAGGIAGVCQLNSEIYDNILVENCLNINYVYGENKTGGIVGELRRLDDTTFIDNTLSIIVRNNISLSKTDKHSIFGDSITLFENNPNIILENNLYDKQMVTQTASASGDVEGKAEGLLTTEMTSFALQSVLGDGWSYAEGRYPIPLGLENDSMALVAATPVYLHFETEDDYNHVDSVTRDFTVGLENNVVWNETFGKVSFNDEYATLLSLGYENLVVSLGDYKKEIPINILDTETSIMQESISENGILYPNPASDYINIKLNGIGTDTLEICDITGKVLLSQTITNDYQQMQIRDLKRGMYFLKIYDKNQNIKTLKFVKR